MNTNTIKKNFYLIVIIIVLVIIISFFIIYNKKKNIFILYGDDIVLKYNEKYQEPGYNYIDENGNDLTDYVSVSDNINIKVPGEYEVTYTYKEKILKRKITVLEPKSYDLIINYSFNTDKITNKDLIINYSVNGETFSELELPNNVRTKESKGSFFIKENGNYKIVALNTRGEKYEEDIVVENIDKEIPIGKCIATLNINNTEIKVEGTDNNGIVKYDYYDSEKLLISSLVDNFITKEKTGNKINVKIYDEAGNINVINCDINDKSFYEVIKPSADENVVFQGETDTLKAYIIKKSGYFLTRVWVKDAYTQLNKAVSPEYGVNLYLPKNLLNKAMQDNQLNSKLIIGFNASGFFLKDRFHANAVRNYPPFDKTINGTIIINNGKLVRNCYDNTYGLWYITGIKADNKMVVFEDKEAKTSDEIVAKKKWGEEVINSGIRNTFNFSGPVILNGQRLTRFASSMPDSSNNKEKQLQLFCQINENNYAIFTTDGGVVRKKAIEVFESIGCQTAVNLDGGGSLALLYKERNSNEFYVVVGAARELPEVAYFTE